MLRKAKQFADISQVFTMERKKKKKEKEREEFAESNP